LIQVTGAGVSTVNKLWDRVFDLIGTPTAKRTTITTGLEGSAGGKISGEAKIPVVAKGGAEINGGIKLSKSKSEQNDTAIDYLQLLIRELSGTGFVVFIDDFHYIPRDVQLDVATQIKEAIRHDVIFVVASVPYHSDDVIRANSDLRGRTLKLDFDYWDRDELKKIAIKGFKELHAEATLGYLDSLADEAAGSPQLMQSLCLHTCFENDLREKWVGGPLPKKINSNRRDVEKVCTRVVATSDYTSTVSKMKEGPKTRGTERNSYGTRDGLVIDVYPLILTAVALDPPKLTLRYSDLQMRIKDICPNQQPSGSSVTGACSHIAKIADDAENKKVIEWDGGNDVLDIRDPYLLFFLRWSEWQS